MAGGKRTDRKFCTGIGVKPLPRTVRKFIGAVVLVVFVPFYALVAMTIAAARLPGTSVWAQTLYFAVAGLIWVVPAGLLIKWMQRPDSGE